jgi:hypothetical protein
MGSRSSRGILALALAAVLGLPLAGVIAQVATEAASRPPLHGEWMAELEGQFAQGAPARP